MKYDLISCLNMQDQITIESVFINKNFNLLDQGLTGLIMSERY